ncbi:Stk1 family PASTA domain-containing Ser/Thr kinase [Schaalia sp. lx-260]|uniref:Stk1 family PASTA domain-containing Ser/Thr kinase n=1 Tax=Schaalia sp. lx-260 TaxID=2899082 RepID=UPI001E34C0AD|nr:Stk1 family PASTA domain-containing Ser/Thr kinase [Schaalia sp. lx-260]
MSTTDDTQPPRDDRQISDPLLGVLVDNRYRITAQLARGGMATVYVADDERLDRPVALKIMHPHLADREDFVARFRREARAAARIVHPGVVSVFDQGVIGSQGYLAMDLIDGPNLRVLLQSHGPVTVERALTMAREILEALEAAHTVGVIHRDIKPENVLICAQGPVRLTDFGLARAVFESSHSTTGSMLGTVAYVAPEVVTQGHTDARTDFYAVGILLYELLTGSVPWCGKTPIQMAMHHAQDDVPAPSQIVPWLPTDVDELVAYLTARDPDYRPPHAREAIEAINQVLAVLPPEIAGQRFREAGTQNSDFEANTSIVEPVTMTAALPSGLLENTHTTIRTSSSVSVDLSAAHTPHRGRRIALILTVILSVLGVGIAGGLWWWNEYGPGAYVEVPTLAGSTADNAQSVLENMGIGILREDEFSDDVMSGYVIDTDPSAGGHVHKNGEVRLRISKGIDMKVVPPLEGLSHKEAINALIDAGLKAGTVSEEWSETVKKDLVVSQSATAGTSLAHDSTVHFVISKGREPITVPTLTGLSADEAKGSLTALGLLPQVNEAFSDTVEEGKVISQDTESGTTQYRGDTVTYTISKGPELIAVPNVFGKQEKDAKALLESAGFTVEVNRFLGGVFGTVRSTDPAAGTMVRRGSVITMSVV